MSEKRRLTYDDRLNIEAQRKAGRSARYIARELGCHPSTVYRELARGVKPDYYISSRDGYSADLGQTNYENHIARSKKRA